MLIKAGVLRTRAVMYKIEVGIKTIDLILIGVARTSAAIQAKQVVDKRWRERDADKSGG